MAKPKPATVMPDLQSKPEFVRKGFDAIANRYDLLNDLMTWGMHRRWKRETIQRLKLRDEDCVLDLCAGTGDLSFACQRQHPASTIVSLDFSLGMLKRGIIRSHDLKTAFNGLRGDAMRLPFPSNLFDGAVVGFGLRNVADIDQTLQEVLRVLKPGATFVSLDTAVVRWAVLKPCWNLYMNTWVPLLGWLLADSKDMYRYLFESSEHFLQPAELQFKMNAAGYQHTGFAYRPRFLGGTALVWGQKPD